MSKRKARQQQMAAAAMASRKKKRIVAVLALLLCLSLAGGIIAQWRATRVATGMTAMLSPVPTPPSPSSPSKEYIYAGGGLLATEEPTASSTSSTQRTNVALDTNGGQATASSLYTDYPGNSAYGNFPASAAINGDTRGLNVGTSAAWADGTPNSFPDWLEITFNGTKSIDEIDIFTFQDDYTNPVPPNDAMTFSNYGIVDFDVQYLSGPNWVSIPNGSVTGNNKVWRKFTFPAITTTKIRVVVNYALYTWSRIVEVEAYGVAAQPPPSRTNVAASANGAAATASSLYSTIYGAGYYPASAAINSDRKGVNGGFDGFWADGTNNSFPDWLQVDFSGSKTIDEIDLFAVQDNYTNPVEPTETMTSSSYGLIDFEVQYWTGSTWAAVPNGTVTGNNKIWRKFTFAGITTSKIRVQVTNAPYAWSRIVEVEAYGVPAGPPLINVALASNGGVATSSSDYSTGASPAGAVNGDRKGLNWGAGGGWADGTPYTFGDWLQVDFGGNKTINEIDVFTLQDDYNNPVEPLETTTFSTFGLVNFDVQYWDGSGWVTVPGGSVTSNNKVWRRFIFSNITTTRIRVLVNYAGTYYSRITELEVWGN